MENDQGTWKIIKVKVFCRNGKCCYLTKTLGGSLAADDAGSLSDIM